MGGLGNLHVTEISMLPSAEPSVKITPVLPPSLIPNLREISSTSAPPRCWKAPIAKLA